MIRPNTEPQNSTAVSVQALASIDSFFGKVNVQKRAVNLRFCCRGELDGRSSVADVTVPHRLARPQMFHLNFGAKSISYNLPLTSSGEDVSEI